MWKSRESIISNCEKKFVLKNLSEWNRLDGRAFDEFRELTIEFGRDWGCCYVSLGETRIVGQVSCEIQQPKSSRPSEGLLNINLELNPMGAPHFEPGRQSELSIQLNRLLEKCIKDSKAIDLESLCIKLKEKAWALRVDLNVLNHEGNILDCASVAALTALAHFRRPDVTCDGEEIVVHTYAQRDPIPTVIHHYPVCITFSIFNNGNVILADPTLLEEGVADAYISVALNAYKELCSLHLGGSALTSSDLILKTTNKAATRASLIIQKIKTLVEEDSKIRSQRHEVGFQLSLLEFEEDFNPNNLEKYLDQWKIKGSKKNKKKHLKKDAPMEVDNGGKGKFSSGDVQSLGKGSAVLLPQDGDEGKTTWAASSDDESEEETPKVAVPEKKAKLDKGTMEDLAQSEEENVVVINKQSNKKKKHKK